MSMIACPGCGLPRADDQLGSVPCPVCAASPAPPPAPDPVANKPAGRDPTAGLPADVAEMHRAASGAGGFPSWFGWASLFLFGIAVGAAGILGWQAAHPPASRLESARAEPTISRPLPPLPGRGLELAPMPHEPKPHQEPEPEPPPSDPKGTLPAPDRAVAIDLNLPEGTYSVPFAMRKGERVVLRGKVHTLRANGLDGGAVLDASKLEATHVYIGGKIDGASVLKVNAPNGKVTVAAAVLGKSSLEIVAPGGDVTFSAPTTPARLGSAIDGGSTVAITARATDLRGDINGSNTRVTVNLPRAGVLKVVAVRGTASVEYRVADGKGTPDVSAAFVSPAATFQKAD